MLSEIEYSTFNTFIDAIHERTDREIIDSDGCYPISIIGKSGHRSDLDECNFILMHCDFDRKIFHALEISGTYVSVRDYFSNYDRLDTVKYNTTLFENNTDEEFFQNSTIEDFSNIDETFLRRLIDLSLLVRKNKEKSC